MFRFNNNFLTLTVVGLANFGLGCTKNVHHSELHHGQTNVKIHIHNQWVRSVPPVSHTSAAYMTLFNHSEQDDKLLSVKSSIAKVSEIHNVKKEKGMMQMHPVSEVDLPSRGMLELKPGSYHVMLINLLKTPKVGEEVELMLYFKHAGMVKVTAPVKDGPPMKNKMDHD